MGHPGTKEETAATPRSRRRKKLRRHVVTRWHHVASLVPADVLKRIEIVKTGVPAGVLTDIANDMAISRDQLYATIGLVRATVNRKLREQKLLSQDESERVMGIARLINQVDTIVRDSGDPERFDAAKWVARWLDRPHPALGGRRPAELMDTADGRSLVSDLVGKMESAAYA